MRKEVVEFVKSMRTETTLDEMQAVCRTTEELTYVLDHCKGLEGDTVSMKLSLSLRIRARLAFKDTPAWEITTLLVQKKLLLGYGKSCAVKDWLVKSKAGAL